MGIVFWFSASSGESNSPTGHRSRSAKVHPASEPAIPIGLSDTWGELVALSDRIRSGDHAAFTTFVNQYYERATRVAYAVVHSIDTAQDIAQDIFIRLWERRETLDPLRLSASYVLTAAHHRALDVVKGERIRVRYKDDIELTVTNTTQSPEDTILDHTAVEAALQALPERWQFALRLRVQEQIAIPEIARALDISVNATHQLLHRAMRELRHRLGVPSQRKN